MRSSTRLSQPLAAQVYDTLLRMILTLELEPHRMLSEASVSEMLGVSRTPAREALARLGERRFVDVLPQRGSRVAPLRMADLERSQFMREALEVALLRRVMTLRDRSALVRDLRAEIDTQRLHARRRDAAGFYASDERFHGLIAERVGPAELVPELLRIKDHMDRFRHLMVGGVEDLDIVIRQHADIVDAIEDADATRAEALLCTHLRRILSYVDIARERYPWHFESSPAHVGVSP